MINLNPFKKNQPKSFYKLHQPSISEYDSYREKIPTGIGGERKFSPTQLRIIWSFNALVLKRHGIHPIWSGINSRDILDRWRKHTIDPAQQLTTLEYQRVLLTSLVTNGEQFDRIIQGKVMPLPPVTEIKYDRDTGVPIEYIWKNYNGLANDNFTLQPDEVRHIFVKLYPGQRRGVCLYSTVEDIAKEKEETVSALTLFTKNASKLFMVFKRTGSSGVDTKEKDPKIDLGKNGVLELNVNQELEMQSPGSTPVDPLAIDKITSGLIGNAYGISRMMASGDFSDVNYSSARFAAIVDSGTWALYQELILDATRFIYQQWAERGAFALQFEGWYRPPFQSIDPVKTSVADNNAIDHNSKSVQQSIVEQDLDVEQTFREIEEYKQRFGTRSQPAQGTSDDD